MLIGSLSQLASGQSVARQWNEECLAGIRLDFPAPTVHARNLFHFSAAMWDAWAAYDSNAVGVFHNESATAVDIEAAREEAISFAAYRVLDSRYSISVGGTTVVANLQQKMTDLGYDWTITTTTGSSPAAVGNRAAEAILGRSTTDRSNQENIYVDNITNYEPLNMPLILSTGGTGQTDPDGLGGIKHLTHPNNWQPLEFTEAQTQNGQEAGLVQEFIGAHWGYVRPFALSGSFVDGVYEDIDPGLPPQLNLSNDPSDAQAFIDNEAMRQQVLKVVELSSKLDPNIGTMVDISPGSQGNNTLGMNDGQGRSVNPVTNLPYAANVVNLGDYGRAVAEYWADGPDSETPPGHWNDLANEVFDDPLFERRMEGQGPELPELEWDVKAYLALNAALHDTAVAAWGVKRKYDYVRPITMVRHLADPDTGGQATDPNLGRYRPQGLPLVSDLIRLRTELIELFPGFFIPRDIMELKVWQGEPSDPETEVGGVGWINANEWIPYQRSTFVTPAFAGYVSGHSAFSRAAAEVMTVITGTEYFPGGLGTHNIPAGALEFEAGPETGFDLQWATYYDAADEAGISRIYGGIHLPIDDGPGRIIGSKVGKSAVAKCLTYFDGEVLEDFDSHVVSTTDGVMMSWENVPGYLYKVQSAPDPDAGSFMDMGVFSTDVEDISTFEDTTVYPGNRFYRVVRENP